MKPKDPIVVEITGRIVTGIIVISSCCLSMWLPLILAPVLWTAWDTCTVRQRYGQGLSIYRMIASGRLLRGIANTLTWLTTLLYFAFAVAVCSIRITGVLGVLAGVAIGFIVIWMLGMLWPYRWRIENTKDEDYHPH